MDLVPLFSTFIVVALAELGDKTQLAAISLSANHSSKSVFLGAMLGFLVVDGVGVFVGEALASVLPIKWISLGSGLIFMVFGFLTWFSKGEREVKPKKVGLSLATSFSLVTLMELGDKTQFAVIALAADLSSPVLVFVGMMSAFLVVTGLSVLLGMRLLRRLPMNLVRRLTAVLFVFIGIVLIVYSITGVSFY